MTWHAAITAEIASMFGDYSSREDEVEEVLAMRFAAARESLREYHRERSRQRRMSPEYRADAARRAAEWRLAHPERARELTRQSMRRERERAKADPVLAAKLRERQKRQKQRARQRNPEPVRAVERAYRARKRQSMAVPHADQQRRAA